MLRGLTLAIAILVGIGCRHVPFKVVPGDTSIEVSTVTIDAPPGEHLMLDYKIHKTFLGLRAKSALLPQRDWNPFRLAEDRRRTEAFLAEHGHYEGTVDEPRLEWSPDHKKVGVHWTVHEGPEYRIGSVTLVGAPPGLEPELRSMVRFGPGDKIDMMLYRPVRFDLANRLQDHGFGHARAYSRAFIDKATKTVAWYIYLDPGPATTVKEVTVEGNAAVPAADIIAGAGFHHGDPFSTTAARRAELTLMDTGAFASVVVLSDADVPRLPEFPEFGGQLRPDQIAADGSFVPRQLPSELAVRIIVVEAPARQLHAEVGIEADPGRADVFAAARVTLRNLFAAQHHLVLAASVGYGWLFGNHTVAGGLYGSALAQYVHPIGASELRVTARWQDVLYPSALLREFVVGPGVHSILAPGVFVEGDAYFRYARQLDQPALDPAASENGLALPTGRDSEGLELTGSIIADRRDDRVEPARGWLLGASATYSPGGALADHRWLSVLPDARLIIQLGKPPELGGAWSVALKASGGVVLLPGEDGVPLGPRLFGGGPYGFRGFGRDQLSPQACTVAAMCNGVLVGGRSLVETSAELRWLPWRQQIGGAFFVDTGAAGPGVNPYVDGVSVAAGVGLRIRIWYIPLAFDVAYRIVDDNTVSAAWGRILGFVRVGEAF